MSTCLRASYKVIRFPLIHHRPTTHHHHLQHSILHTRYYFSWILFVDTFRGYFSWILFVDTFHGYFSWIYFSWILFMDLLSMFTFGLISIDLSMIEAFTCVLLVKTLFRNLDTKAEILFSNWCSHKKIPGILWMGGCMHTEAGNPV